MQREIFTAKLHATFVPPETIDVLGLHGEVDSIAELDIHEHTGSGEIALPDLIGGLTPDQPITVFDLGRHVNLNAIVIGLGLETTEFEPQMFAGLAYAPESIEGAVVLFGDGNGFTPVKLLRNA